MRKRGLRLVAFVRTGGGQFVYETGIPEDDELDDAVTAEPESPGEPGHQTDPAPVMLLLPAPVPEGTVAELDREERPVLEFLTVHVRTDALPAPPSI